MIWLTKDNESTAKEATWADWSHLKTIHTSSGTLAVTATNPESSQLPSPLPSIILSKFGWASPWGNSGNKLFQQRSVQSYGTSPEALLPQVGLSNKSWEMKLSRRVHSRRVAFKNKGVISNSHCYHGDKNPKVSMKTQAHSFWPLSVIQHDPDGWNEDAATGVTVNMVKIMQPAQCCRNKAQREGRNVSFPIVNMCPWGQMWHQPQEDIGSCQQLMPRALQTLHVCLCLPFHSGLNNIKIHPFSFLFSFLTFL